MKEERTSTEKEKQKTKRQQTPTTTTTIVETNSIENWTELNEHTQGTAHTARRHKQNYREYLLLRVLLFLLLLVSRFDRSFVLFFIVLVNCVPLLSWINRMNLHWEMFAAECPTTQTEKSILKCDKSNSTEHVQCSHRRQWTRKKTRKNWMGIRAYELSIARKISNWLFYFYFRRCWWHFPSIDMAWLGPKSLVIFMLVVAVIGHKLCDVPPSLVQVGLNWLSGLIIVWQAINMRKTKLTNNKNV